MQIEVRGVSIESEFYRSDNPRSATLVLSHPHPLYGGTLKNKVIDQLFYRAKDRKISAFRYNTRGTGTSSGQFSNGAEETLDLEELVAWLKSQEVNMSKLILIGYSFGSWITANVAAKKFPNTCVLIAPPVTLYSFPQLPKTIQKFIFSAGHDELIPPKSTATYFDSLQKPKKHLVIDNADHYFIGTTSMLIKMIFQTIEHLL